MFGFDAVTSSPPTASQYAKLGQLLQSADGLVMAEAVEKVGALGIFATIVPPSGACGNIDYSLAAEFEPLFQEF